MRRILLKHETGSQWVLEEYPAAKPVYIAEHRRYPTGRWTNGNRMIYSDEDIAYHTKADLQLTAVEVTEEMWDEVKVEMFLEKL